MEQLRINAKLRQRQAKGDNRRLRREGQVPATVYGGEVEPRSISINHHELELFLRGARHTNALLNLDLEADAGQEQTLIREIQRHPVTGRMVHLDFQRVDLAKDVQVEISIRVTGTDPKGVKAGGILEHLARSVEVRCKPLDIPKYLEADLSELEMNQSFHVSNLKLPEGVLVLADPEAPLFTIVPPKLEAEPVVAEAVEGEAGTEPEVIGKKKEAETEEK